MVKLRGVWTSGTTFFKTLEATKNDYGETLHIQTQNRWGSGVDLSTTTVGSSALYLSSRRRDDTTNLISGLCIDAEGAIGFFTYTIQSGDFVSAGKHHLQASHQRSGVERTFGGMYIHVKDGYGPRA